MSFSVISFLLALIVITTLLVIYIRSKAAPQARTYRPYEKESHNSTASSFDEGLVQSKWAEIQTMQNSGPSGLKAALIDADKLLDYCMIGKGFTGETMGDRLKSGGDRFNNVNSVWAAHKLRNQIAHEVSHDLVADQVKRSISDLGLAIKDLGVRI